MNNKGQYFPPSKVNGMWRIMGDIAVYGRYGGTTYKRVIALHLWTDSRSKARARKDLINAAKDSVAREYSWMAITSARLVDGFIVEGMNGQTVWID